MLQFEYFTVKSNWQSDKSFNRNHFLSYSVMKNCWWNFKYHGGEIKKGRARHSFARHFKDLFFNESDKPEENQTVRCRTPRRLLIIRSASKHTCLSARRRSNPPQSVPLEASCTDPISHRVNPASFARDFCRPSSKELFFPSTSLDMVSSSTMFTRSNHVSGPFCSTIYLFDVWLGTLDETIAKRSDERITGIFIIVETSDTIIRYCWYVDYILRWQLYKQSAENAYVEYIRMLFQTNVHRLVALFDVIYPRKF